MKIITIYLDDFFISPQLSLLDSEHVKHLMKPFIGFDVKFFEDVHYRRLAL